MTGSSRKSAANTFFDILLRETDAEYVKLELDTYWVKRGGEDPAEYLEKLHNRCPLLHIKDMEEGDEQFFLRKSGKAFSILRRSCKWRRKSAPNGLSWNRMRAAETRSKAWRSATAI